MKKELMIVAALVLLATGILFALNLTSGKPNTKRNGFERKIGATFPVIAQHDFTYPIYEICNIKGDSVFCTGRKTGMIYLFTNQLKKLDTFNLNLPWDSKIEALANTSVSFPNVYILAGNAKKLIAGNLLTKQYTIQAIATSGPFSKPVQLNHQEFIMRVTDTLTYDSRFEKYNMQTGILTKENALSRKLADGGFTDQGMLHLDADLGALYFVSYYSNNLMKFDTALNLVYRKHTLDTVGHSTIHVVKSKISISLSRPSILINSESTVDDLIYVRSRMRADNEKEENQFTIDSYNKESGAYVQSHYLPALNNKQEMINMKAQNNVLYAIYDHSIIAYQINN